MEIPLAKIVRMHNKTLFLICPHCSQRLYNMRDDEPPQAMFGTTMVHYFCNQEESDTIGKIYKVPHSVSILELEYNTTVDFLSKAVLSKAMKSRGYSQKLSHLNVVEMRNKCIIEYPASQENLDWIRSYCKK